MSFQTTKNGRTRGSLEANRVVIQDRQSWRCAAAFDKRNVTQCEWNNNISSRIQRVGLYLKILRLAGAVETRQRDLTLQS